jgi:hypothetical protein
MTNRTDNFLLQGIRDHTNADPIGKQATNGVFGQRQSESRQVHVQSNFRYNIPDDSFLIFSSDGTSGTSGTGNYGVDATADAGVGFVETGTGSSGSAIVQDRNRVRYGAGQESGAIFTARFTTDPDATLRIGLHDQQDGFYLGHDGSEYFFGHEDTGTETKYPRSNWIDPLDGTGPSGETIDFSQLNIFRITFGYLGTAPAFLEHYAGPETGWIEVDHIDFTDMAIGTHVRNPSLPLRMEATRPSGDGNARVGSGSWMGYVLSNNELEPGIRRFDAEGDRGTVSSSTDEHIITIQNKETYQGVANDIQIVPEVMNPIADADDTSTFYITRGAVTADSLTFTDRNTENSVAEVATDATTVNSVDKIMARRKIPAGSRQSGSKGVNILLETERLEPGERMTVYANSEGTSVNLFEAVVGWRELF